MPPAVLGVEFLMARQPMRMVAWSPAERALQVVAGGALVTLLAYALRVWPELPTTVPTHFGFSGAPDAWGGRSGLLVLPVVATLLFVVLTVLERVPHVYNYPVEVTATNAARLYALGRRLILSIKLILVAALGLIFFGAAQVALGKATALPGWLLPLILGSIAGVVVVTIVKMSRTRLDAAS